MINPDKTLIIKDTQNLMPQYSLPPGSKLQAKIEGEVIYFKGNNKKTAIELEIYKAYLASLKIF